MHALDNVSTGIENPSNILCVYCCCEVWIAKVSTIVRFVAHSQKLVAKEVSCFEKCATGILWFLAQVYIIRRSIAAKIGEVLLHSLPTIDLFPQDVLLVEEQDDRHRSQPSVVPDLLKQVKRLS